MSFTFTPVHGLNIWFTVIDQSNKAINQKIGSSSRKRHKGTDSDQKGMPPHTTLLITF